MPFGADDLPRITIVTPSYNQGEFLEATLRSVLLQGYSNVQFIVMDGGSTDESVDVLERYAPWLDHWESRSDRGQSHAINRGFEHAEGEIFGYLNSDDVLLPGALHRVARAYLDHKDEHPLLLMGNCSMGGATLDNVTHVWKPEVPANLLRDAFDALGLCPQPATFWTRTADGAVPRVDESMQFAMDLSLWVQLFDRGYTPVRIDHELAFYRVHESSKSMNFQDVMWLENAILPLTYLRRSEDPETTTERLELAHRKLRHFKRIRVERVLAKRGPVAAGRLLLAFVRIDPGLIMQRQTLGLVRKLIQRMV